MSEDVKNRCRICLDVDSDHVSILEDPGIQLHIKSCLSMTISSKDNLPKTVCVTCVSQLGDFYHFQLNARCSQDWLESCIEENAKETKVTIQPLPDSEYNSDSLLEFLNNTANIDEYLNNLGKEDIPSIVNMLGKNNENSMDTINKLTCNNTKNSKGSSPKKKELANNTKMCKMDMEIDILDSDLEIVQEMLMKETMPNPKTISKIENKQPHTCFGCKAKFDSLQKLSEHVSICDEASRTCLRCNTLFDSKLKMLQHRTTHFTNFPVICTCRTQLHSQEKLLQHYKICSADYSGTSGYIYRCKKCSQTYKDRLLLYKHVKTHLFENICDICTHSFTDNEALINHKKKEHKIEDVMYRCKVCSHTSKDRKDIYLHVKRHTVIAEPRRHLCESCGQCFSSRSSLMRHSILHKNGSSTRGKYCQKCRIYFNTLDEKNKHICDNEVMCEHCGLSVSTATLDSHSCVDKVP